MRHNRPQRPISRAECAVAHLLNVHGAMSAARCSSAHSHTDYAYWGAAEYEIRIGGKGYPIAACVRAAGSDRRSTRLAHIDTEELAESLGGIVIDSIGRLRSDDLVQVWDTLDHAGYMRHVARQIPPQPVCPLGARLVARKRKILEAIGVLANETDATYCALISRSWATDRPVTIDGGIRVGVWLYNFHFTPIAYFPLGDARDAAAYREEKNVTRRRMIWEACGVRLAPTIALQEMHRDDYGTLYSHDAGYLVKVVNSSPEPDGSYKDYFLRVPYCRTAREAVAWTFGMTAEEYVLAAQS